MPVAERRRMAIQKMEKLRKKGQAVIPVTINGRTIASTFWGKAWCDNLEAYSDYSNRLPRGRTYVRNGSVIDLQIQAGMVNAHVSGSDIYKVEIKINPLQANSWRAIKLECSGKIMSLLDLLSGRLSQPVMEIVTRKQTGLFPSPKEISFNCSCPDWAYMCKHIAAVLYGVGARLDHAPELLFFLRNVEHGDLITRQAAAATAVSAVVRENVIAADEVANIFGIDIDGSTTVASPAKRPVGRPGRKNSEKEQLPAKIKSKGRVKMKRDEEKTRPEKRMKKKALKEKVGAQKVKRPVDKSRKRPPDVLNTRPDKEAVKGSEKVAAANVNTLKEKQTSRGRKPVPALKKNSRPILKKDFHSLKKHAHRQTAKIAKGKSRD